MVERAIKQYRVYCYINLAWYALLIILCIGMAIALKDGNPAPDVLPEDQIPTLRGTMVGMAIYGWIFFALTLFLMKPVRTTKWWMGSFINICLGVSTCFLAPFCIPMAIRWNSKEVRDHFNQQSFEI
jgi:hypothetical protein